MARKLARIVLMNVTMDISIVPRGDYQGITIASATAVGAGDISEGGDDSEVPTARIEGNRRTIFVKYRIKYKIE
jgi:hypothetical protein